MPRPIAVRVTTPMLRYARTVAARRAKRESGSPYVQGDERRVDRDLSGVLGELAFYEWRYGTWQAAKARLDNEQVARGLTDGGEDDVGIDVKGGHLVRGRTLERQHLLVKAEKLCDWVRYVAAFYAPDQGVVYLAGYLRGEELRQRCPEPQRVADYGFLNHMVAVTDLKDIRKIPHAVLY